MSRTTFVRATFRPLPADGLPALAIKIETVVWFLDSTDAVLDSKGLRQLRALAREARLMALERRP
ncbi:MAG: hypothetical protein ABI216_12585 [Devosia sp.]